MSDVVKPPYALIYHIMQTGDLSELMRIYPRLTDYCPVDLMNLAVWYEQEHIIQFLKNNNNNPQHDCCDGWGCGGSMKNKI